MSITRGEDVLGGEPGLEGTRIGVRHVSARVIDNGQSPAHVADQLYLSLAEVYEVHSYYYAHIDELRDLERESEAAFEQVQESSLKPEETVYGRPLRSSSSGHIDRIFKRLLRERGHEVEQAKDRVGKSTADLELLEWCDGHDTVLVTTKAKDFEPLHQGHDHADFLLYYNHQLPNKDPKGLARTVDAVFNQFGTDGVKNQLVDPGEWYEWLHE